MCRGLGPSAPPPPHPPWYGLKSRGWLSWPTAAYDHIRLPSQPPGATYRSYFTKNLHSGMTYCYFIRKPLRICKVALIGIHICKLMHIRKQIFAYMQTYAHAKLRTYEIKPSHTCKQHPNNPPPQPTVGGGETYRSNSIHHHISRGGGGNPSNQYHTIPGGEGGRSGPAHICIYIHNISYES